MSDASSMTVAEIKAELDRRGLKTTGKKADLVDRLQPVLDLELLDGTETAPVAAESAKAAPVPVPTPDDNVAADGGDSQAEPEVSEGGSAANVSPDDAAPDDAAPDDAAPDDAAPDDAAPDDAAPDDVAPEAGSGSGETAAGAEAASAAAEPPAAPSAEPAPVVMSEPGSEKRLDMSLEEIAQSERMWATSKEGRRAMAEDRQRREREAATQRRAEAQAAMAKRKEERRLAAEKAAADQSAALETRRSNELCQLRVRVPPALVRDLVAAHFRQFGNVVDVQSNPAGGVYQIRFDEPGAVALALGGPGTDSCDGTIVAPKLGFTAVPDLVDAHSLTFEGPAGVSLAEELKRRTQEVRTFFAESGDIRAVRFLGGKAGWAVCFAEKDQADAVVKAAKGNPKFTLNGKFLALSRGIHARARTGGGGATGGSAGGGGGKRKR